MSDISHYVKLALDLGKKNDEALEYGTKMFNEAMSRDKRAKDRQLRQFEIDSDNKDKERIARDKTEERAHALEMAKLGINTNNNDDANASNVSPLSSNNVQSSLNLPLYSDSEDIASYILRFERISERMSISRDTWPVQLGCLLTGRAFENILFGT